MELRVDAPDSGRKQAHGPTGAINACPPGLSDPIVRALSELDFRRLNGGFAGRLSFASACKSYYERRAYRLSVTRTMP